MSLALDNLGDLDYMEQMGALLLIKKKKEKQIKNLEAEKEELSKIHHGSNFATEQLEKKIENLKGEIKVLQKEAKNLLELSNEYRDEHITSCVYSYI